MAVNTRTRGWTLQNRTGSLVAGLSACALLGLAGCMQIQALQRRMLGAHATKVTSAVEPSPAQSVPARAPTVVHATRPRPVPTLRAIILDQLQSGHYAEGKRQLHRYLHDHPDDRVARDFLWQLTVNPERVLGSRSRVHVVRPGETYGSLAARYLGHADRFLLLARYNHATDPSSLRVGQHVRVPQASSGKLAADMQRAESRTAGRVARANANRTAHAGPVRQARQWQHQSVLLLDHGHRRQALQRLAMALRLDPKLPSSGSKATRLRRQLLASYHQRAIVLYRDQKLEQAISLWNRILVIDPGYEPAIIYRARARELQARLKQI